MPREQETCSPCVRGGETLTVTGQGVQSREKRAHSAWKRVGGSAPSGGGRTEQRTLDGGTAACRGPQRAGWPAPSRAASASSADWTRAPSSSAQGPCDPGSQFKPKRTSRWWGEPGHADGPRPLRREKPPDETGLLPPPASRTLAQRGRQQVCTEASSLPGVTHS